MQGFRVAQAYVGAQALADARRKACVTIDAGPDAGMRLPALRVDVGYAGKFNTSAMRASPKMRVNERRGLRVRFSAAVNNRPFFCTFDDSERRVRILSPELLPHESTNSFTPSPFR
jgi:hypothetical protein